MFSEAWNSSLSRIHKLDSDPWFLDTKVTDWIFHEEKAQ